MFKFIFQTVLFFVLISRSVLGGEVIISGQDSTYIGIEMIFNTYADEITGTEMVLGKCKVLEDGTFTVKFDINEVTFVFANLGIYKVHIYAEPGQKYQVLVPPRSDKEPQELLNPYFSPIVTQLAISRYDENELNTMVRMFNDSFQPYYNKHILEAATRTDFSQMDKDIDKIEKPFEKSTNIFFNEYRKYKYGLMRHLGYQQKSKSISVNYFKDQPVLYNNPAYMELFNKVYDKYFFHLAPTSAGKKLDEHIAGHNLTEVRNDLASDQVLGNAEFLDLVMLKCIHDEFYDDNYSRSSLLILLDDYISTAVNQREKSIAISIKNKVTRLLAGYEPPIFELYNKDSSLVRLDQFKGKYVYLNFCSCFSYTCMNEFVMLNTLYQNHKDKLEIITILVDNDYNVVSSFLSRSNYNWVFLHYGNQAEILSDFDIRAFPTYFLIAPDGKLVMSPAPGPADDFESRLFNLMKERGDL